MQYYLYKLKFSAPVHFGNSKSELSFVSSDMTFSSSTLFSALCNICGDDKYIERLISLVQNNKMLLSDGMPYKDEILYIPRPLFPCTFFNRIQLKRLSLIDYISIENIRKYYDYTAGEILEWNTEPVEFGKKFAVDKVSIRNLSDKKEPEPFSYGIFDFYDDSGLYFIVGLEDENDDDFINSLVKHLGIGGMGGGISRGYGSFEICDKIYLSDYFDEQTECLFNMLENTDSKKNILLSTSLPSANEMEKAYMGSHFDLVPKSGYTETDKGFRKKSLQYFMKSGSVFQNRFKGDLYIVGNSGRYNVYRYGKSLFLGV